jgi:glycerol-3-phosphate acyltransferase PlsY
MRNQPDTGLVSNKNSFLADAVDKNVSADQLKVVGKSGLARVWKFAVRPLAMFYTALEAGNVAAWLGVAVLAVSIGLMIYWHRADIKQLVDKLKAKFV